MMPSGKIRPFDIQRPLVCAAVAYGAGILFARCMAFRPLYGAAGLACAVVAVILFRGDRRRRAFALFASLFCIGLLYAGHLLSPSPPPSGSYEITAYVTGEERLTSTSRRAVFLTDVRLINADGESYDIGKVYWSFTPGNDEFALADGRQIAFTGRLYAPSPQMNPYGFDFRMYLLTQGVFSGVSGAKNLRETGLSRVTFSGCMLRARQAVEGLLDRLFAGDAAMPKALLLGVRDELPEDIQAQFRESGIAHVLAVSGLHVALLAGLLLLFLRPFRLTKRARLVFLAVFLLLYCALLNFTAPVMRASLLLLLAEIGRLRRRRRDGLTLLAAAFLIILLIRPLDLFSASFQLSFTAVMGIALLYRPLARRASFIRWRALRDAVCLTLSASLSTALPIAALFHRLSPIGILVSPLVCAFLMPLLLIYVLSLLAGAIYLPLGQALAQPAVWLGRFISLIAGTSAELPFAAVNVPMPNIAWFVLACALALSVSGYLLWKKKSKAILCLSLLFIALGADALSIRRDVTYIQFSVSQQDAALLIDGRETVLIDTAQSGGDVADYLLSTGLSVDTVILTHLHADHCLGLYDLMEARIPIGRVLLPVNAENQLADPECLLLIDAIRERGIPLERISAGDTLHTARASVTVLFPDKGKMKTGADANLYAAALLIESGGARILYMSDTDGIYEDYIAVPADILKIAHHGSDGATGDSFLAKVSPDAAIISCGAANDALPSPRLLDRLSRHVRMVYRTDVSGALTITFGENAVRIMPYHK